MSDGTQAMLRWQFVAFDDFDLDTLYAVLRLRAEVFVVEQNCPYLDLDGYDRAAWHLLGWQGDRLAAYARVFGPGAKEAAMPEMAVGRVITAPFARGQGLGRPLMLEAMRQGFARWGAGPCRVEAQAHLAQFYGSLGFVQVGGLYDEDGIPHITMIRPGPGPES